MNTRESNRRWPIWQPLTALLAISVLIRIFDVDRKIAAFSYDSINDNWPFYQTEPWLAFYRYGTIPPMIVGFVGIFSALFGRGMGFLASPSNVPAGRLNGLFLTLMLLIGPGLLVEVGLKTYWGRPRPLQCEDFGGEMTFLPLGEWASQRLPNSSFPSGHAAAAFFLMGPGMIVSPRRPRLRIGLFLAGLCYGAAMGFTRVLQGGHFLSDVLWAGFIVYFVGAGLERLLFSRDQPLTDM